MAMSRTSRYGTIINCNKSHVHAFMSIFSIWWNRQSTIWCQDLYFYSYSNCSLHCVWLTALHNKSKWRRANKKSILAEWLFIAYSYCLFWILKNAYVSGKKEKRKEKPKQQKCEIDLFSSKRVDWMFTRRVQDI